MDKKKKKYIIIITIICSIILIDQIAKVFLMNLNTEVIPGILRFTRVENTGGAFGIGQNSTMTFVITNIVVLGIIIRFMMIQEESMDKKTYFALCLILGGGIGNVIDRIFRGYVVDFIDLTPIIPVPIFNIADICIVSGFVLLAIFFGIYTYQNVRKKKIKD